MKNYQTIIIFLLVLITIWSSGCEPQAEVKTNQALVVNRPAAEEKAPEAITKPTALDEAAMRGRKDVVELLVSQGAPVTGVGSTAFGLAVANNHLDIAEFLLGRGADINGKTSQGNTALHLVALVWDGKERAQWLLSRGADVNCRNNDGWTPLHMAASQCFPDIVRFLLDQGADVFAKDNYGSTPLSIASKHQSVGSSACPDTVALLEQFAVESARAKRAK